MFVVNHETKRIMIYKLQAQCASGTCCFPDCRAKNTGGRTCDEHGEYKVHVWSESQNFRTCQRCWYPSVRQGHCCLCLRRQPFERAEPHEQRPETERETMNLAEMIDSVVANGGDGQAVVDQLIEYGHLPPDANARPAHQTAREIAAFYDARKFLVESGPS